MTSQDEIEDVARAIYASEFDSRGCGSGTAHVERTLPARSASRNSRGGSSPHAFRCSRAPASRRLETTGCSGSGNPSLSATRQIHRPPHILKVADLFDFPPALGDISGLQGRLCPNYLFFTTQQIVSLPEFFMDGHAAQQRMSWRHFHMARLASPSSAAMCALCAVLVLLSLACFLPGFSTLQPMDRDEPRYAQASKQMLETGDLVDIRFQDEARHKKPVGIYWLQSAAVAIGEALGVPEARTTIALYRIPSLLGAIATVLLTYWAALAFFGRRGALSGRRLHGDLHHPHGRGPAGQDRRHARRLLGRRHGRPGAGLSEPRRGRAAAPRPPVFWLALRRRHPDQGAAGADVRRPRGRVLSVGAFGPLAARPAAVPGPCCTLLVVLPWFVAIAIKSGGAFFSDSVGHDMLGKVGDARRSIIGRRRASICSRFSRLSGRARFWPRSRCPSPGSTGARSRSPSRSPGSCRPGSSSRPFPTKLPHYVMPLFPAIAILTVMAISRHFVGPHRPAARLATILIPFIPIGLAIGLVVAATWNFDDTLPYRALPALRLASRSGFYAWWLFVGDKVLKCMWASSCRRPCFSHRRVRLCPARSSLPQVFADAGRGRAATSRARIRRSRPSAIASPASCSLSAPISRCWRRRRGGRRS